ncbi:hypothetical protein ACYCA6_26445, partial [Klebsiella pneumoniae]
METRGYDASSLTQSLPLLPFGCGGRYLHTDKSKDIRHDKRGSKRMRRCRFSIGSAPLTSITESTLKSVVAKPDRTIKIS